MTLIFRLACACLLWPALAAAQALPPYPETRRVEQLDSYHGQTLADPYRWLEDDNAPDTAAWVRAQNQVTDAYFARQPFRDALKARLAQLLDHPRYSPPQRRGDNLYYLANTGLQNQSLLVRQQGLGGAPEVVLDPNTLSPDGTTQLRAFELQPSGHFMAFALSQAGSDWQTLRVMDLNSRALLDDRLQWVKVSSIAWAGEGFFYSRYPEPAAGRALSERNEDHQVWFHRMGMPQSADALVYADSGNPQRFHTVSTTPDGRFAVLYVSERGKGRRGNAVFVRDLNSNDTRFVPMVPAIGDHSYEVLGQTDGQLVVRTDHGAPKGRVLRIDPRAPAEDRWQTLVVEGAEPLASAKLAGGRIFLSTLKDVTGRLTAYRLDGTLDQVVELPGLGTVSSLEGGPDDTAVFYSYTSFEAPATVYRYDIASGRSTVFREAAIPGYDRAAYETRQVFYTSRDGTQVPMFLVHRKGLKWDGTNPTLLYGYGGFNVVVSPSFNPLRLALLEQGVVYAVANLRGGGEYGQAWHLAGSRLQKQNTFDDFIAAAEWLIAEGITRPDKLAVQGGSNGGLLVGAVVNQRPELFAAAVPQVGVMDMLRFHKFTIGWNWIADYGSSDNADEFKVLRAISPLHNIRPGVRYPATLVTTADHDDRVVPAHSFKYAATLQAQTLTQTPPAKPALIRIETSSGHGASSTAKRIEGALDVYGFLFQELGVKP